MERAKLSDLDELEELATMVQSMALCGLGKSAPLPVISTLKRFRDEYEEHIRDKKCRCKSLHRTCVSSISIRNSVSAAVNVRRTVRQRQFPERSNIRIISTMSFVSSAVPVKITVTLMQFMWKHRKGADLWVQ